MQEIVNIRDTMKALEPEANKKPFAEVLHEVQEYIEYLCVGVKGQPGR